MLKNAILDAKIYENFAKIWRNFDKILLKFGQILQISPTLPASRSRGGPRSAGCAGIKILSKFRQNLAKIS